jgi:cytochrome c-type biogenesis protein
MTFSLAAIFAAGLLTFVSPCVLPLMPIYLATISGGSLEQARPRRTLALASAFAAGLAVVFVVLGALASSVGTLLVAHRTAISLASGVLMLLFGARALGLVRVQLLDRDARPGLDRVRSATSLLGAFFFGGAFALGWSPCIGPVLAAVLTYAATHADSPLRGAGYLAVYAAGVALPLLVLAAGAGHAACWLKRVRGAIPRLEKVTGALLVAVGVWTLAGTVGLPASVVSERTADVMPGAATMLDAPAASCAADGEPGHTCALPEQTAEGALGEVTQPAGAHMLEFTSHECPVCKRMRPVLDKLVAACTELDTRIVRVDVSTPSGRALADRHGVRGTPTFVLLDDGGVERARLLGENSSEDLAAAVERAFGLSCWG